MAKSHDTVTREVSETMELGHIDTGGRRAEPRHQACPGRITERRLAMGVRKSCSSGGQLVDVWGLCHWMPSQVTDPVVLIVNGDEQYVRLCF